METSNRSAVPPPAPAAKKSNTLLITIVVLVLAVFLLKSLFRTPTGARAQDSSASTVTSTQDSNQDSTQTASSGTAAPERVAADAGNPVIGMWLLASAQPDSERGQYGVCSTYIRFGKTTYSRNYDGKVEEGWITYIAGPTKVWVTMQGLQTTSYGVNPDGTIVAQDYPAVHVP